MGDISIRTVEAWERRLKRRGRRGGKHHQPDLRIAAVHEHRAVGEDIVWAVNEARRRRAREGVEMGRAGEGFEDTSLAILEALR